MARPIEDIRDINDSKDLWKIVVRIRYLWSVTNMSNKEHMEIVLVDGKVNIILLHSETTIYHYIMVNILLLHVGTGSAFTMNKKCYSTGPQILRGPLFF